MAVKLVDINGNSVWDGNGYGLSGEEIKNVTVFCFKYIYDFWFVYAMGGFVEIVLGLNTKL